MTTCNLLQVSCCLSPILKLGEFVVDLLDVDVLPVDVVVAVDAQHDGVVESVELLQQRQLLAIAVQ